MERFPSKIDSWLLVLLIVAVAGQIFALIAVTFGDASGAVRAVVAVLMVSGVLLTVSVLLRTHYTVSDGVVRIVSGPFVWTIEISEITAIEESRSALSSPAMSLDRLRITYKPNKCVLVSPADKKGFLKAIERNAA